MKHLITIVALMTASLRAGEPQPTYHYEGEVAGVVCSACSSHVKAALSKLEGVREVKIALGKEGSLPRIKLISTSPNLTREAAVKSLGEEAKMYDIRSLFIIRIPGA
ncbi:Heavy-metal-associated domain-containing protein [Prosthecobacter debontii]|uniref:Heavy-metal-associated domain-containing protein n=1 Tax=Prosthecobacter debontii TaxID=48467 RepID=A0A1T4YIX0_9BACT|nr:heavy metal-associated domain-containing protein [Prosthecobacter debontii]SKB01764.1 Heavy-metal-associated domain-containing protein [Prosthecobacter debontii]